MTGSPWPGDDGSDNSQLGPAGRHPRSQAAASGVRGRTGTRRRRLALARTGHAAARPCSGSICCSESSRAPSSRRSPTRRSPECPPQWPGSPPRWPPPAARSASLGIAIYGNDRGIELVRRRDGVHQRGARRVVAVAGARRRHPGHGPAQHRTLGLEHQRAGSDMFRRRMHRRRGGHSSRSVLVTRRYLNAERSRPYSQSPLRWMRIPLRHGWFRRR